MEFTIGFYDTFDHLTARASVQANDEMEAIAKAVGTCGVRMSRVGRIDLTSADREWLDRLNDDADAQRPDAQLMNETYENYRGRIIWDGKHAGGGTFERGE